MLAAMILVRLLHWIDVGLGLQSVYHPDTMRAVLGSLAGIPQKAGFYLTLENWRRELLDFPGLYNSYFHTSDIFLSLVYLCARLIRLAHRQVGEAAAGRLIPGMQPPVAAAAAAERDGRAIHQAEPQLPVSQPAMISARPDGPPG